MTLEEQRFHLWQAISMKKMLVLSMAFHFMFVVTLFIVSASWRRVFDLQPVYQVNLVTLPSPPKPEISPPKTTKNLRLTPPEPVVKKHPKPDKPEVIAKSQPKPELPPQAKSRKKETVKKAAAHPRPKESTKMEQTVTSVPPMPSVQVDVDAPDFPFPFYLKLIQGKIGSVWSPPDVKMEDEPTEVVVSFTLITTGKIESIQVEKSSGNTFFDQAALRAIYMASPLPPLPRGFSDPDLKIHFSFLLVRHG